MDLKKAPLAEPMYKGAGDAMPYMVVQAIQMESPWRRMSGSSSGIWRVE
jgi:hypothetical protein